MQDDTVMNVPQPDSKKFTVRKVLLIVWLVICTALFIYFLYRTISLLIYDIDLYDYYHSDERISSLNKAIAKLVVAQVAGIFIYASVCVLLIPKIIAIFRSSTHSNSVKLTMFEKKILLTVWILICAAAVVYIFVYTILEMNATVDELSANIQFYNVLIESDGDRETLETAVYMIQYYKLAIVKWVFILLFALSCTPIAVLFIPKVRTVFMRYKAVDVFPDF